MTPEKIIRRVAPSEFYTELFKKGKIYQESISLSLSFNRLNFSEDEFPFITKID